MKILFLSVGMQISADRGDGPWAVTMERDREPGHQGGLRDDVRSRSARGHLRASISPCDGRLSLELTSLHSSDLLSVTKSCRLLPRPCV